MLPSTEKEFKRLQSEGKVFAAAGKYAEALAKFELAREIFPGPKLLQRINVLKAELSKRNKYKDVSIQDQSRTEKDSISCIQEKRPEPKASSSSSKSSSSNSSIDLEFKSFKKEAKKLALAGKYDEALECFQKALTICDDPTVRRYMQEVELVKAGGLENDENAEHQSDDEKKFERSSESIKNHSASEKKTVPSSSENGKDLHKECVASPVRKLEDCDQEMKFAQVKVLYEKARELASTGMLRDALKALRKAHSIHETEKVCKRIKQIERHANAPVNPPNHPPRSLWRLTAQAPHAPRHPLIVDQEMIAEDMNNLEEDEWIEMADGFKIFRELHDKLYPYQRAGILWMYNLYKTGKRGGVLADDMGLGKTLQVAAFLSGMIDADLVKSVLIILPVSLITNWEREFKKWCPGIKVCTYHGGTVKQRQRNLLKVQKIGHVLLTTYGLVRNQADTLSEMEGRSFVWDYVILDEGHKIKNACKTTKAVYDISARNRIVLTGTPIQNNLKELWTLFDFTLQGTLLGSRKTFNDYYDTPITRSREKDATAGEKQLGLEMSECLKALISPYFLRRTKDEIWGKNSKELVEIEKQIGALKISMGKKKDMILWTIMSEPQIEIYKNFLHSDAVKSILVSKRSPLVELTVLKKICDHPRLLPQGACLQLGLDGELQGDDVLQKLENEAFQASSIESVSDEILLLQSGKLRLLIKLLMHLKDTGHRTLVFSQSRKILDMVHRILLNRKWKVMRLDGTIAKIEERERRVQVFQTNDSYPVFLLTTQVGGVGLTLTAADRVIIYDPAWNPATDAQAVDRAFRIGQEKDVVVYRLITCGTVEEKIYRRQIFKDSIRRQTMGQTSEDSNPHRYFSQEELRELFTFHDAFYSDTQVQLEEMHGTQNDVGDNLQEHVTFIKGLDEVFGISNHDLMFSKNIEDQSVDNDPNAVSAHFIKQKVKEANSLIRKEGSVTEEGIVLAGSYKRPYQEKLPFLKKGPKPVDGYKPPAFPEVIDLTDNAQEILQTKRKISSPQIISKSVLQNRNSTEMEDITVDGYKPPVFPEVVDLAENVQEILQTKRKISSPQIIVLKDRNSTQVENTNGNKPPAFPEVVDLAENAQEILQTKRKISSPQIISKSVMQNRNSTQVENTTVDGYKPPLFAEVVDLAENAQEIALPQIINKSVLQNRNSTQIENTRNHSISEESKENLTMLSFDSGEEKVLSSKICQNNVPMEENICDELNSLDYLDKEKIRGSLSQSVYDNFGDINLDLELTEGRDTRKRRSCASKKSILASYDFEDTSTEEDSSSNASQTFAPNSASNTPKMQKDLTSHKAVSETPPCSSFIKPELLSGNTYNTLDAFARQREGSIRRITPLKVDKSLTQENPSFTQAMASSIIITPQSSPSYQASSSSNNDHPPVDVTEPGSVSLNDESIIYYQKRKVRQLSSSSEESNDEYMTPLAADFGPKKISNKFGIKKLVIQDSDLEVSDDEHKISPKSNFDLATDKESNETRIERKKKVRQISSESEGSAKDESSSEPDLDSATKKESNKFETERKKVQEMSSDSDESASEPDLEESVEDENASEPNLDSATKKKSNKLKTGVKKVKQRSSESEESAEDERASEPDLDSATEKESNTFETERKKMRLMSSNSEEPAEEESASEPDLDENRSTLNANSSSVSNKKHSFLENSAGNLSEVDQNSSILFDSAEDDSEEESYDEEEDSD